jgi:hypothetical protein
LPNIEPLGLRIVGGDSEEAPIVLWYFPHRKRTQVVQQLAPLWQLVFEGCNGLQVAAFTAGRTAVSEYDALLMRNVLWSRPEDQDAIYDWLLGRLAVSGDLKQSNYLLASLFGRTCHALDVCFSPYHCIASSAL